MVLLTASSQLAWVNWLVGKAWVQGTKKRDQDYETTKKRKTVGLLNWLKNNKADVVLLQET